MATKKLTIPQTLVWTKQSAVNALFHPLTGPMPTAGIKNVRKSRATLLGKSGLDAEMIIAYQITNTPDDEGSWDTPIELGSWARNETTTYGSSWSDISSDLTKRFARFGVNVRNITNSAVEAIYTELDIDIRED